MAALLVSCNNLASKPDDILSNPIQSTTTTTQAVTATPLSPLATALHTPSTLTLLSMITPIPEATPSPEPTFWIPTIVAMNEGLTWVECPVPDLDYTSGGPDIDILRKCVNPPQFNADDLKRMGKRKETYPTFYDLSITIGHDHYETRLIDIEKDGCCNYELAKNGNVILKIKTTFGVVDPNRYFWNIGGKLVWELVDFPDPVIIVDGVNYNEKYRLEGSYFPYEIKGKLIYVEKKSEKYHIVYNDQFIGPEFDDISMAYCCGMVPLIYGNGQYWFVGTREGKKYLGSIK